MWNYFFGKSNNSNLLNKDKKVLINECINKINSYEYIKEEDFQMLKILSISKGGFMDNKNRAAIYTRIFGMNKYSNNYYYYYIFDPSKIENCYYKKFYPHKQILQDTHKIMKAILQKDYNNSSDDSMEISKNYQTIIKDINRSFSIKRGASHAEISFYPFHKFFNYSYTQGFLDILVAFITVFTMDEIESKLIIPTYLTYIEIFHKDYFLNNFNLAFINEFLREILKIVLNYNENRLTFIIEVKCFFNVCSWILTSFCHGFNENFSLRVLDYLLLNKVYTAYVLSAMVIKMYIDDNGENEDEEKDLIEKYLMDNIDKIIEKTQEFMEVKQKKIEFILQKEEFKLNFVYLSNQRYEGSEGLRKFIYQKYNPTNSKNTFCFNPCLKYKNK